MPYYLEDSAGGTATHAVHVEQELNYLHSNDFFQVHQYFTTLIPEQNQTEFFQFINTPPWYYTLSLHTPNWKAANVFLILKKYKKEDSGNYRLVSLTSINTWKGDGENSPGRHILTHERQKWSSQHGVTKRKSYLTNLLAFLNEMTGLMEKQKSPVESES